MIIKDKQKSTELANEISHRLMDVIKEECDKFKCDDDPVEYIYLLNHIIANLMARICIGIDGYSKIYNIEILTIPILIDWINTIALEHIEINKKEFKLND